MTPALDVARVRKHFGGIVAAGDVSLRLAPGERHALIGPNGAGKTTLVNLITGALRPDAGTIALHGRDVTRLPLHERVGLGLARSFQITSLFATFSVFENIALAVAERQGRGRSLAPPRGFSTAIADEAEAVAAQVGLRDAGTRKVGELAYGQQRLAEIAVTVALRPRVLLLDEPAAGLAVADHGTLLDAVARLQADAAVLLIEHDMGLVFRFAHRITVLAGGAVLATGSPDEIAAHAGVRAAYLGTRRG